MLPIRQVLRLGARVVCTRHAAYCHVPILREPSSIGAFRQMRFTHEDSGTRTELGKLKGKLKLMFTCKKCKTRTSKMISKLAYNKGVVIVRCDGCNNNHLIADNLGWFSEIGKSTNIERIMEMKGETVRKIMNDEDGYYEAVLKEEFKSQNKDADEIKSDDECSDKIKIIDKSQGS
ncbi:DNL-type zinc finger protein [Trachymyrmex septentrionalis]|uniref:DNL-type zinc finger protein n=1 Tax=Trachymyrmex septentrionalis TaxID=34720 RepID=A0A151JZK5_9HYME|nr:PREDICTED: DNL-type zinc finger protein-like [Trachymyrmex septentrionalis]KYN41869.1 DNL-type zinc finger protein [Trachymyrmex septentrionalis]